MTDYAIIDRLTSFFAVRELDAYVVGGTVRDRLLGRSTEKDIDLAVPGDAVAIARELAAELGGSLAPLSVPRGMMRVALANPDGSGNEPRMTIDLSGFSESIEKDLARRDFSVNAMAVALPLLRQAQDDGGQAQSDDGRNFGEAVIDPHGGRGDLMRKTLRALGPDVFKDDPGRLLRAVRLAGELGLRVEPDTVRLLLANAHLLPQVAPDRVREEFLRLLALDGAMGRVQTLDYLGMLQHVIPELMEAKGVDQPRMHYWDVWGHSLHTVEAAEGVTGGHQNSPVFSCVPWTPESEAYFAEVVSDGHTRRTIFKLAALFHDIAKPQTKTLEPDGRTRFFGHSEKGAVMAEERLRQLRLSSRGVSMVSKMVEHHLRPAGMSPKSDGNRGQWPTNRAIHRYFRDVGDVALDTLYLCLADYLGAKGPELAHPEWLNHARMISHVLYTGSQPPFNSPPLGGKERGGLAPRLVNGHDLMSRFGLPPGPQIGSLLSGIEEARAAGEIETQEQALELAAAMLKDREEYSGGELHGLHLVTDEGQGGSG